MPLIRQTNFFINKIKSNKLLNVKNSIVIIIFECIFCTLHKIHVTCKTELKYCGLVLISKAISTYNANN